MKSFIIALLLTVAAGTMSYAQCGKKVSLTSSKTEHFDASGALKHADDEKTVVEFDTSDIAVSITRDAGDQKMTGKIKSNVCAWKVPFKDGKTLLSVTLTNDDGQARDFAITIEGKDGKVALWAESKDEPDDKIKLDIDKFELKN